jgi:RNA polymerase sigma factor (sigma-70 family)
MSQSDYRQATEESIALAQLYEKTRDVDDQVFNHYFRRIVYLIEPRMSSAVRNSVDAEDLAQSVLFHTLKADPGQRVVSTNNGSLWPLLAMKAIKRVYRAHRDATTLKRGGGGTLQSINTGDGDESRDMEVVDEGSSVEDEVAFKELREAAINQLTSETHRDVFRMFLAGAEEAEIADKLGCSDRTVRRSLKTARDAMLKEMAKWNAE